MYNAVIIDSQNLFKEGFRLLLENMEQHKFHFTNLTLEDLYQAELEYEVDLIFLEMDVQLVEQIKNLKKLRRKRNKAKIAILSTYSSTKIVRETFQCGVDAYFLKSSSVDDFYHGINEMLDGKTYMTEGLRLTPKIGQKKKESSMEMLNDHYPAKQKLTKREREVLEHIVQAKSNGEIGELLFISEQTVGVHKKNIMRKLGVHNTVSLVRFAIDHNLA